MHTTTICEYADEPIYDLRLVDIVDGVGKFRDAAGQVLELPMYGKGCGGEMSKQFNLNQRGVARPGDGWVFHRYVDQTLSRVPELDQTARLGWRCDARPEGFTCPAWIVPGENGGFVEEETETFQIRVPPEFLKLCDRFGLDVEDVIHGFIADAAGLMNWVSCPRADELSSHGSDERMLAQEYIERTWRRG